MINNFDAARTTAGDLTAEHGKAKLGRLNRMNLTNGIICSESFAIIGRNPAGSTAGLAAATATKRHFPFPESSVVCSHRRRNNRTIEQQHSCLTSGNQNKLKNVFQMLTEFARLELHFRGRIEMNWETGHAELG